MKRREESLLITAGQNLKGNIQKSDDGNIVVRKWIKFQNTECRKKLILTVDI